MTSWLVTGAGGMLGTDLVAALSSRGEPVIGMDRASLDVTDAAAVTDAIAGRRPDVVVNCAAWTAVDDAEASEEQALAVNAGGAASLAAACAALGSRLVQQRAAPAGPRPAYSVLGHHAWADPGVPPIGEWRTALHRAFPELVAAQQAAAAAG